MSTENKYQFKGTPGEWEYQRDADEYTHIVRAGRKFMCQLSQDRTGESKANAHLIAAAPDLLFAAIKVIQSCNPLQLHDSIDVLEEAVNKALNITE